MSRGFRREKVGEKEGREVRTERNQGEAVATAKKPRAEGLGERSVRERRTHVQGKREPMCKGRGNPCASHVQGKREPICKGRQRRFGHTKQDEAAK